MVLKGYNKDNFMKKAVLPDGYKYIAALVTMRCNLNCSFCLNAFDRRFDRRRFEEISAEKWAEALNRIDSRPDVPVTFSGGEPFLHKGFIRIINHLKPELPIDILTNLQWGKKGVERFIREVEPERLKRNSPYASIRVSYHPEQMRDSQKLVDDAKRLQDAGFSIGIWAVQYPSPQQLEAITQMQFRCRNSGIDFRLKDFTGRYEGKDDFGRDFSITYGDYSKYPGSAFSNQLRRCKCRTSELLIGPNASVYRCHRDMYAEENSIGSLLDENFELKDIFRPCNNYGQCHPCDVKAKTNYRQQLGHTSVEITETKD